jgi:hypothetical protein
MKRIFGKSGAQERKSRRARQRGSIMLLTAVTITGMVGMLALSIDLGFLFSARSQFQNGIDAAALAGATGLRVSIEADAGMPQQASIVKSLAVQYASFNQVRRYADPDPNSGQPNSNNLVIDPANVVIDAVGPIPRVDVAADMDTPLLFAGIFGFSRMTMRASSQASLFPVDGGTGTISGNGTFAGCWRPLFLPDTFFDSTYTVQYVGGRVGQPLAGDGPGDYYRSRFAVGARNVHPYIDGPAGDQVTGLRDTESATEIGVKTIMGMNVVFPRDYYFVANFSGLPRATIPELSAGPLATFGYCGQIRVGDDIPIYPRTNVAVYDEVRVGLQSLKQNTDDVIDTGLRASYKYIKSASFPGPNTHGSIIPVLLYDPFLVNSAPSQLRVTNFGLFFLDSVSPEGTISGFFVREIMIGGTPILPANYSENEINEQFKPKWLPMSVRLLK